MLTVLVRSVILFCAAVMAMRLMGKRQVGQLQPYELVVAIMIAELAATPVDDTATPLVQGLVPMAALMICHGLFSALCMRNERAQRFFCGQPAVLIRNGVICEKQLRKTSLTLNDLMEALRVGGMLDPSEVGAAILETGGQVSVFPKAEHRPLTPGDLGKAVTPEGIPLPLILDGSVQEDNLRRGGLEAGWLGGVIRQQGFEAPQQVLFACLNTRGELLLQGKGALQTRLIQVLEPEKAVW